MYEIEDDEEYMTVYRAARFLGVCSQTLRNWHREGKLIPSKVNIFSGIRYYNIKDLKKFLKTVKKKKMKKAPVKN